MADKNYAERVRRGRRNAMTQMVSGGRCASTEMPSLQKMGSIEYLPIYSFEIVLLQGPRPPVYNPPDWSNSKHYKRVSFKVYEEVTLPIKLNQEA